MAVIEMFTIPAQMLVLVFAGSVCKQIFQFFQGDDLH